MRKSGRTHVILEIYDAPALGAPFTHSTTDQQAWRTALRFCWWWLRWRAPQCVMRPGRRQKRLQKVTVLWRPQLWIRVRLKLRSFEVALTHPLWWPHATAAVFGHTAPALFEGIQSCAW